MYITFAIFFLFLFSAKHTSHASKRLVKPVSIFLPIMMTCLIPKRWVGIRLRRVKINSSSSYRVMTSCGVGMTMIVYDRLLVGSCLTIPVAPFLQIRLSSFRKLLVFSTRCDLSNTLYFMIMVMWLFMDSQYILLWCGS